MLLLLNKNDMETSNQSNLKCQSVLGMSSVLWNLKTFFIRKKTSIDKQVGVRGPGVFTFFDKFSAL